MPFSRSHTTALSRSPLHSPSAFLQSITPAPVFSRSSFTIFALTSIGPAHIENRIVTYRYTNPSPRWSRRAMRWGRASGFFLTRPPSPLSLPTSPGAVAPPSPFRRGNREGGQLLRERRLRKAARLLIQPAEIP